MSTDPAPSPYSANIPRFQVAWDSTSLGWYKTCPTLYRYQMLEGWEPRARGLHLVFGGLYAASLERYAHSRASEGTHDEASLKMVRWALENSGTRDADGMWTPWSDPTHTDAHIKNRFTLIRTLVWNAEERKNSPFHTVLQDNGKPAVELSFSFQAFEIEGEPIHLSGHMDEVVEHQSELWVLDDKTTKNAITANYFSQYTPNNQMSLYSIAGKVILRRPIRGVLVKAAQIGVNFSRFNIQQIPRPKAVLDEWMADTGKWITRAREDALSNHWPMNDKSCFLCAFKKVCAVSPSHRDEWLRADFHRRTWNPLQARGDI